MAIDTTLVRASTFATGIGALDVVNADSLRDGAEKILELSAS